jgi:pyruvate dehydrogenase E1 component alpha subunit
VRGHYEGDPGRYRDSLAEAEWKEKDPILRLERHGMAAGWYGEDELRSIGEAAAAAVEGAVRFGLESPFPPSALLEAAVYADG